MKFQFLAKPHVDYDESLNSVKILKAAKRVFVRDGGAAFSARGVAKEAKVSLGAVQHFFPSKHDLLAAMLEYVVNQYEGGYQKLFQKLPLNGRARLLGVIDMLIRDIWDPDTRRFFIGFWALACHNESAAELKAEMYAYHVHRLGTFIGAAHPGISEARARALALQLAAMIEGLMLFSAPRGKKLASREQMSQMVKDTILELLPDAAAQRRSA